MSIIRYHAPKNILVLTKGHPFERDRFFETFESFETIAYTAVEQPAAQKFCTVEAAKPYDAFVHYDMPGIDFVTPEGPHFVDPSDAYKEGLLELLDAGHGFVFLHHAIAGWPTWPEYSEIVGGRFLYKEADLRGVHRPDSGYRHDVEHTVEVVNADHPITNTLSPSFKLTDELYLYEVFEESVEPILRSGYKFSEPNFYSSNQAVKGNMFSREGWRHEPGSNLVGWVKHYKNSPIAYIQFGDSPVTYKNSNFVKVLENAINWVSSDAAKEWARSRNQSKS